LGSWHFDFHHSDAGRLLTAGWSNREPAGVWSVGPQSRLTLPLATANRALRLHIQGLYYGKRHKSVIAVNGAELGDMDLTDAIIDLPGIGRKNELLTIALQHRDATSPKSRGESKDERLLGFYLETISVEALVD
jgi:hypothetical protein